MPPPLDKVLPGLPPALNGVVMRALQKDAPNRYATALEMANELTNIRAGLGDKPGGTRTLSLRASIETALARERDTRRRIERRSRLWLAGAVAVAVVAAGAAGLTMSRRGKPEAGDRS